MEYERETSMKIAMYSTPASKRIDLPSTGMEKIKGRFEEDYLLSLYMLNLRMPARNQCRDVK